MPESNAPQEQSPAPDFNEDIKAAQQTGDFNYVLDTAKKSHRMLVDFRDAIHAAVYPGKIAPAIAMGLNFLENMIANSANQLTALKQAEKETREALKKAAREKPQDPAPVTEAAEDAAVPAPTAEATEGPANG